MSKILASPPITLTITISPMADGTATVETRVSPEKSADVLMLTQALLGVIANYVGQAQRASSMLVGGKKKEGENG